MKEKRHLSKVLIGTIALLAVALVLLFLFFDRSDTPVEGNKNIIVQVIVPGEDVQEFSISTDATTLKEALDEENLIQGKESSFGFYIVEVNGRVADDSKNEWWTITKDGEYIEYGVSMININDKDKYELTLMEGY